MNEQYGKFNEPDVLYETQNLDSLVSKSKKINLDNKLKTVNDYNFYNVPSQTTLNQQTNMNDMLLQKQNIIMSEKIKNNIYNKISVSEYQKEEINKMYDKLKRLEILKNIENKNYEKKNLLDNTVSEIIRNITNEWVEIFQIIFNNDFDTKTKLDKITSYPVSIGIFLVFISICIFLSI